MALTLADRQEIADLLAAYNWAIDHFEAEAWAATFTPDGALIANGGERARGAAALTAYVAQRRETGTPQIRHWATNIVAQGDGATAKVRAYVMAFRVDAPLGAPYVMGEYEDDLVKLDGAWKFLTRRMTVVGGASATGR